MPISSNSMSRIETGNSRARERPDVAIQTPQPPAKMTMRLSCASDTQRLWQKSGQGAGLKSAPIYPDVRTSELHAERCAQRAREARDIADGIVAASRPATIRKVRLRQEVDEIVLVRHV